MQIYLIVVCDGLEDAQEDRLKKNLSKLQEALQKYVEDNAPNNVAIINECHRDYCDEWQLGITQPIKKSIHLKFPVNLFNDLANQFGIDCEVGSIENGEREPVCYFGKEEGVGDPFLIAEYLGL